MEIREYLAESADLRGEVEHALALGQENKARRLAHAFAAGCLPQLGRHHPELGAWFGILMRLSLEVPPAFASNQTWLWPELAVHEEWAPGAALGQGCPGRVPDPSATFITQDPWKT